MTRALPYLVAALCAAGYALLHVARLAGVVS